MPATIEQRRAILDREIAKLVKDGWSLGFRSDTEAQFSKERKGSGCGCLSLGLLYWLFREKRPLSLYITVDDNGKIKRTKRT